MSILLLLFHRMHYYKNKNKNKNNKTVFAEHPSNKAKIKL